MTIKVYWSPTVFLNSGGVSFDNVDVAFIEPVPYLKEIFTQREKSLYFKCYAFLEYCKNVYIIKAPCDYTIKVNKQTKYMNVDGVNQETYKAYFDNRGNHSSENDPYLFSALPAYTMYADSDVYIEALPMFLHKTPHLDNVRVMPGTYNIGKWVRSLDFSAELIDTSKPLVIKRGDPLFCIRFVTPNNDTITLERVLFDDKLAKATRACSTTKHIAPWLPLNKLYEISEPILKLLGFQKKSKCPFRKLMKFISK